MPEESGLIRCKAAALGLAGLALLALAMFLDVLIAPGSRVLGTLSSDLAQQFLPWRDFGFEQLAKGNVALWNPHIFAGAPFFGGLQSALLYPPNWLFMVLPLPLAANLSIALNVWLLGAFMYLWGLRRELHPGAAFVSAALVMFCAPYFHHVFAGHVTNLAAMPWVPLIFLAIDEWLRLRRPAWCLLGMLAVAMQILAGHPQYVYFTAIVAGAYVLFRLLERAERPGAAAAGALSMYAGGALLAAVQLLAAFQASSESVRDRALPLELASSFGFPPENLVTLIAPGFFGGMAGLPYWGRWYLWEACAFIGVSGLGLAAYGMAAGKMAGKKALLATLSAAVVLALGASTPLFRVLFDWFPFYDRFRGAGKFIFLAAVLLALFAAYGMDRILRERAVRRGAVVAAGIAALTLAAGALAVRWIDWSSLIAAVLATGQSYADPFRARDPAFARIAGDSAAQGLWLAALTLGLATGLALWMRVERRAAWLLGALAVVEVFVFARINRPTFDSAQIVIPQLREHLDTNPGDYRILNLAFPNSAISMRAFDGWGYDPGVTRRYAELIHWSEGADPAMATQYVSFRHFHRLLAMLRVKYLIAVDDGVLQIIPGAVPPLRRLELIGSHQVHAQRDAILRAMGEPSFDPRKQVILEREPQPLPVAGDTQGQARLLREGTDFMEIEANVLSPSVLLVTDAWTPAWRAMPLERGSTSRYQLVPANYALRGVALDRGTHRLRIEYAPSMLRIGAAVSALSWAAWLLAALLFLRRGKKASRG